MLSSLARILGILGVLALAGAPAAAAGPDGIAFAQAEEGSWWCQGSDSARAFACAVAKCRKAAPGQDCHATRWCMPSGWSGLMIAWLPEFHTTQIVCGMPGQAAAGAALEAVCNASVEFSRCDLVLFIGPDGAEIEVTDTSWLGPSARN